MEESGISGLQNMLNLIAVSDNATLKIQASSFISTMVLNADITFNSIQAFLQLSEVTHMSGILI